MNILVTGGSRGIGKGIALELNNAGHNLLLVAKTQSNLEQAKSELSNQELQTEIFACDLTKESEIDNLFAYSESIGFKPDVLVFDAGPGRMESFIAFLPCFYSSFYFWIADFSAFHFGNCFMLMITDLPTCL